MFDLRAVGLSVVSGKQPEMTGVCYTGRLRRNLLYLRRTFLRLNDISLIKDTYTRSWTVTEIMTREKCGFTRTWRSTYCAVPL